MARPCSQLLLSQKELEVFWSIKKAKRSLIHEFWTFSGYQVDTDHYSYEYRRCKKESSMTGLDKVIKIDVIVSL